MKIIQHRVNDILGLNKQTNYAEVDVWIDGTGKVLCHHEPDEDIKTYPALLMRKRFEGFFINIKQSLSIPNLSKVMAAFEDKVIGLFDVPWPQALEAHYHGCPVYFRLSEYEAPPPGAGLIWLDPLMGNSGNNYLDLISQVPIDGKVIIASPELHGRSFEASQNVWRYIKSCLEKEISIGLIEGIVTRYPKQAAEIFND